MKRLLAAMLATGGLAAGLISLGGGAAGASPKVRTTTTPTVTLGHSSNLVAGQTITVNASGFTPSTKAAPQSAVIALCNSDGATGTLYATKSCKILNLITPISTSGGFSHVITMPALGEIAAGATTSTPSECPQTEVQDHVGAPCILAVANLSTNETAFVPVFWKMQALTLKAVKQKIVGGVQLYKVSVNYTKAYEPVSSGSQVNNAGFYTIGTYVSGGKTILGGCQGSTNGTVWGILPACTGTLGEKVQVLLGSTVLGSYKSKIDSGVAGDFHHTFLGVKAGHYTYTLKGVTSGQIATGSIKVG